MPKFYRVGKHKFIPLDDMTAVCETCDLAEFGYRILDAFYKPCVEKEKAPEPKPQSLNIDREYGCYDCGSPTHAYCGRN